MKSSLVGIPSLASIFSAYASLTAFISLFQQAYNQLMPEAFREYIQKLIEQWFNKSKLSPTLFTLVVEESDDSDSYYRNHNQVFDACEKYLCSKLRNSANCFKVTRPTAEDSLTFRLTGGQEFSEVFEGVELHWKYMVPPKEDSNSSEPKKSLELTVLKDHKDKVLDSYLPSVLRFYDGIREKEKVLQLHTLNLYKDWQSVDFKHSFTFDSLAMDPEIKKSITDDLDRFLKRKDFYKKVGKAWKRGYLLYGPPGTGKSSLIAAMANYLNFDIYDLQLGQVDDDSTLRNLMLYTENKSILVIEDIDCSMGLPRKREVDFDDDSNSDNENCSKDKDTNEEYCSTSKVSLSALLNFLDGLWSSCGDERIIILTTNRKEKLDPALLRPGRMDMHIRMSYLTMNAFRILASNYLDIADDYQHPLLQEIEGLIQTVKVTAAQVAEELMRSENIDAAFGAIVELLKKKKSEAEDMRMRVLDKKSKDKEVKEKEKEKEKDDDDDDLERTGK